jgi:hypothetical protein
MVTLGLSIVAGVMFLSLFFSGFNVAVTVVSTAAFYGGIITLMLLIDSGTLGYYLGKREEEQTKREQIRLTYHQQQWRVAEAPQIAHSPATDTLQLPASNNFVAPLVEPDSSVRREAITWLMGLYGSDGQPDPKKVLLKSEKERPGRVRVAGPSRPAKQYLMDKFVLLDLGTGFRLNLSRCPTFAAAQNYLTFDGVGGTPTHPHHPLIESEVAL